jgi:hypothetical protein
MDNDNRTPLVDKSVEQAVGDSFQSRATQPPEGRTPLLALLSHSGEVIAPWWSKRRDWDLDRFWKAVDYLGGAYYTLTSKLGSVPFRIEPRDASVARWRKLAEEYQYRLEAEADFGAGWFDLIVKALLDLYSLDNGLFLEVIGGGPKDGPIKGLPVGIAHLDSQRCTRTGSVEYPVLYEDTDGRLYKLHRSRVLFTAQMPSPRADMYGVGFCWTSRCINVAQSMLDIQTYKQEKFGSRPKRAIGITQGGLDPESVQTALQMSDSMMDNQGLRRYSKIPFVGDETIPDADLSLIDMASLPDGFDYEQDVTLGMFTIALAGSVPPRWLWPATTTGATKADAMYQHVAGLTGGPGATLKMIANLLGGPEDGPAMPTDVPRFLPPQLKMVFDFQDDEQDRASAEIAATRAKTRTSDINAGIISPRVAREQMLKNGEITQDEFDEMELDDARLPDGMDVLTLFHSNDGQVQGMLAIDAIGEPLDVGLNNREQWIAAIDKQIRIVEAIAVNGPNAQLRRKARQAVVAMQKLKDLYQDNTAADTEPMNEESENVTAPVENAPAEETPTEEASEEAAEVEEDANPFDDDEMKSLDTLRTGVRAAIRGLWDGTLDRVSFLDAMDSTIDRNLTEAFYAGAAVNGIAPNELTADEQAKLRELINGQLSYILPLADAIEAGSKANGGALEPLISRADMWANRYNEAQNQGQIVTGGNLKYQWVLGPTEHCSTCLRLSGKIKRAETWAASPLQPQSRNLECGGWRCQCALIPTDLPLSPGPLPRK